MSKMSKSRTISSSKATDSTEDLVLKAKVGDRSAQNEIVRRSLPRLRRFAHGRLPSRVRHGFDTEDLVQDSMLHTLQRLSSFDPTRPGGLQAYLRVAIQNRVRDECRRRARFGSLEELAELTDAGPSPFEKVNEEQIVRRQQAAIERLRPADRALLVARIELGYDYKQIARLFDKPTPDAARVAVHRALRRAVDAATDQSPGGQRQPSSK
jgi:RNA polymerase sigma-70 factor (ECF subfamily)